jgi:hypothetical protein
MAIAVAICLIAAGVGEAQAARSTIRAKATVVSTTSSYAYDAVRARVAGSNSEAMREGHGDAPDPLVTIIESTELRPDEPMEEPAVAGTAEPIGSPTDTMMRRWRVILVQFLGN